MERAPIETWQVRVGGRVQGVGYRQACVRQARRLGIDGWVRNRLDGSVEALLQGAPATLERLCDWLREGVATARVDELSVRVLEAPQPRCAGFEQRPTE